MSIRVRIVDRRSGEVRIAAGPDLPTIVKDGGLDILKTTVQLLPEEQTMADKRCKTCNWFVPAETLEGVKDGEKGLGGRPMTEHVYDKFKIGMGTFTNVDLVCRKCGAGINAAEIIRRVNDYPLLVRLIVALYLDIQADVDELYDMLPDDVQEAISDAMG